jgi:hypothetical protein
MTTLYQETQTPGDRATTFQAVQGNGTEQYSGGTLLVVAYAVLWVVMFVWVALVWRKQRTLDSRLADLEGVIQKASKEAPPAK